MKNLLSCLRLAAALLLCPSLFSQHPCKTFLPEPGREIFLPRIKHLSPNALERGPAPAWNWMRQAGGSGSDRNVGLVDDAAGNLTVTGSFSGGIQLEDNQSLTSSGINDGYIVQYGPNNNLTWSRQIESLDPEGSVYTFDLAHDGSGNLYVLGSIRSEGLKIGNQNFPGSFGSFFVAKFSSTGTLGWVSFGDFDLSAKRIVADGAGNAYVLADQTIYGFNAQGSLNWNFTADSPSGYDFGAIALDGTTLRIAGAFESEITLGAAVLSADNAGFFIAQYELATGTVSAQKVGTADFAFSLDGLVEGVAADNAGNTYLAGVANIPIAFGAFANSSFTQHSFLVKIAGDGTPLWLSVGEGDANSVTRLILDASGNPVLHGLKGYQFAWPELPPLADNAPGYSVKINPADGSAWWRASHQEVNAAVATVDDILVQVGSDNFNAFIRKAVGSTGALGSYEINESDSGYGLISSVEVDETGIYVMGNIGGTGDELGFDYVGLENNSLFVAKLDVKGNAEWALAIPGVVAQYGYGESMVLDKTSHNLYCLGTFNELLMLGDQFFFTDMGRPHGLLIQLHSDGSNGWAVDLKESQPYSLAVDAQGDIVVAGLFNDAIALDAVTLTELGSGDAFIAKYSAAGTLQWAKRAGGSDVEYSCMVSTDSLKNINFAIESYSETVDYAGVDIINLPDGSGQILLGKLNASGDFQWVKSHGSSDVGEESFCFNTALKTDAAGNSYMMGFYGHSNFFGNTHLTSPYLLNNFIAKFDPAGDPVWVKPIQTKRYGANFGELDIDPAGNCYPSSQIRDTVRFDNGLVLTPQGTAADGFVAKYGSATGELDWVKTVWGVSVQPLGQAVYDEESLLWGGYFTNLLQFDNGQFDARGGTNGFVGLLGADIMVSVGSPVAGLSQLRLFPNPSKGVFQVEAAVSTPLDIQVLDEKGSLLYRRAARFNGQAIDLKALPAGVYFVKISSAGKSEMKRVIIE